MGRGDAFRQWRPFAVAIVAVLVVAFFPGSGNGTRSRDSDVAAVGGGRPANNGIDTAPGRASPSGSASGLGGPAASGGRADATGATGSSAGSTGDPATTVVGDTANTAYPGVGTEAALANPNCDPATRRIRFPLRYAPPCVAPWPKGADNGGATYPGVTADTIKLVLYDPPPTTGSRTDSDRQDTIADWRDYVDIFNQHYELWGRRVEVIYYEATGSDEVSQRADAIRVTSEIKPFFSTVNAGVVAETYSSEVAARGVVVIDANAPWRSTQLQVPHRWASTPDERMIVLHFAEYAGKRLTGRPAQWAGDPSYQTAQRAFGLVYPDTWDKGFIDASLAARGVPLTSAVSYTAGEVAGLQERARAMISRLQADGVTTVIDGADWTFNIILTKEATAQLYRPEWVMTGWAYQDVVLFARLFDQQQWSHAFGPGPVMVLPPAENYETSGHDEGSIWQWHYGDSKEPRTIGQVGSASSTIVPFLACVQLAGPRLTPETFRDGCFAYPPTGGTHCGCIMTTGFSFGQRPGVPWLSYTAWDDMAEKWWDPSADGPDEAGLTPSGGYYRRTDGGRRYTIGEWPASEPRVFDPNGTVTYVDKYPERERPPQYEHQPH